MHALTLLLAKLRRLNGSRDGNVLMLFCLGAVMLFCAAGVGIDMGRAYSIRLRLNAALDAAGLAVATLPSTATSQQQLAQLQAVFNANYPPNKIGGGNISPSMSIVGNQITVSATTSVNTLFMQILPGSTGTIAVEATSVIAKGQTGLELAIVLDNTGSMLCGDSYRANPSSDCPASDGTDHQQTLVTEAQNMVTTMVNAGGDLSKLKIAFVPYVTTVNVGQALSSASNVGGSTTTFAGTMAMKSGNFVDLSNNVIKDITNNPITFDTTQTENTGEWRGCILEPNVAGYSTSEPAGGWTTPWNAFYWEPTSGISKGSTGYNSWNATNISYPHTAFGLYSIWAQTSIGPNNGCPTPMVRMMPMTGSNPSVITTAMSKMVAWAAGGTIIHEGMIWGWRAISPNPPFSDGVPYTQAQGGGGQVAKVVVLETDGLNESFNPEMTAFGTSTPSISALNTDLATICTNMKNAGIIIYTVGLGVPAQSNTTLQQCAGNGNGKYIAATNGSELNAAFQQVATELNQLRIVK